MPASTRCCTSSWNARACASAQSRAAHPLRGHHVGDLLGHPHRALRRGGDQAPHRVEDLLLLIHLLQPLAQRVAIEPPSADRLEPLDEPLQRRDDEREPMRLDQLAPPMPAEFPPARRQIAGARMIDLEEFGAECLRPQAKDAMNAVAGEPGTEQPRRRQPAPGRLLHIAITRRGIAEAAVAAQTVMVAVGVHRVEIRRRLALGGHHRRPPLIADRRDVHEIEQLERHVGLHQRVRLPLVEHAAPQIGEPLLLERRRGHRGVELLVSHDAPPFAPRRRLRARRAARDPQGSAV